eukprot:scaffold8611_cov141-Skeletonema_dohrnii-CCMP3373.AAC.1
MSLHLINTERERDVCLRELSLKRRRDTSNLKDIDVDMCSKMICNGCSYANDLRELSEESLNLTCPFCRHPLPTSNAEIDANIMKRVDANDPVATRFVGIRCYDEGDYRSAFEYLTKAARMGDMRAHYHLSQSQMSTKGEGVEKDEEKEVYHLEQTAIAGHPTARYNLGVHEWNYDRVDRDRAVKHFIITAKLGVGDDDSVEGLKQGYLRGLVSKEDFAAALRAHQAAVDAMKSPQRETMVRLLLRYICEAFRLFDHTYLAF